MTKVFACIRIVVLISLLAPAAGWAQGLMETSSLYAMPKSIPSPGFASSFSNPLANMQPASPDPQALASIRAGAAAAGRDANKAFQLAKQKEKAGKVKEAETLYWRSISIRQAIWADRDPAIASILEILGNIYQRRGDYARAEICFARALKIEAKLYGFGRWELSGCLRHLGEVCYAQKKYREASDYLKQVVTLCEGKYGWHHPDTMSAARKLADSYKGEGNLAEAESIMQRLGRPK